MFARLPVLCLTLSVLCPAATSAAIHVAGSVVDASGAPVPDVLVSAGPDEEITTDADGRFDLSIPGTGPVTLTAVATDWQPTSIVVDGDTTTLRIVLLTPTLHQTEIGRAHV